MGTLVLEMDDRIDECASVDEALAIINARRYTRQLGLTCVYGPIEMFLSLLEMVNRETSHEPDRDADRDAMARWKAESDYSEWLWLEEAEDRVNRHDTYEQRWLTYGGFRRIV